MRQRCCSPATFSISRGDTGTGCPEPAEAIGEQPRRRERFVAPEELAQLPGFDEALYEAVADCVTVATSASAIDPRVAPRTVLLAIPGATPALVDAYLDHRETMRDFAGSDDAQLLAAAPALMTSPMRDFTISAVATIANGARIPRRPASPADRHAEPSIRGAGVADTLVRTAAAGDDGGIGSC